MTSTLEISIRQIIRASVQSFADGFALRHVGEKDDPDGVINMKIRPKGDCPWRADAAA